MIVIDDEYDNKLVARLVDDGEYGTCCNSA